MRALDSFFESGGEMPEDGAVDAPMHDDSDDEGLDEEELSRAEAGAGNRSRPGAPRAWCAARHGLACRCGVRVVVVPCAASRAGAHGSANVRRARPAARGVCVQAGCEPGRGVL
jgi:hypothetical protein